MKTLIIYGTKHGCAEKCSKLLKDQLNGEITIVDLKKQAVTDLSSFDRVVIGGSIYVGKIQKQVSEFCIKNLAELKKKKVGLFICCMNKNNAEVQLSAAFPDELLNSAVIKECFGGAFAFKKMNMLEKLMVKMVSKADEGIPSIDGEKDISSLSEEKINKFARLMNNA
jgi:menaquinone-dependent protoporphyrinogen oxidase